MTEAGVQDLTTPSVVHGSEALGILDRVAALPNLSAEIKALVEERVRPLVLDPALCVDNKTGHGLTTLLRFALAKLPNDIGRPLSTLLISLLDPDTTRLRPAPDPSLETEHQLTTDDVFPGLYDDVLVKILSLLSVPQLVQLSRVGRGFGKAAFMAHTWAQRFALDFCDAYSGTIMDGAARAMTRLAAVKADGIQYQRTYLSYNLLLQCVARLAPRALYMNNDVHVFLAQQKLSARPLPIAKHNLMVNLPRAWTFKAPRTIENMACFLGKNIGVRTSPAMPPLSRTETTVAHDMAFFQTLLGIDAGANQAKELAQLLVWDIRDHQHHNAASPYQYRSVPTVSSRFPMIHNQMHPVPVDQLRTVMPLLPLDFPFRRQYYASKKSDYILDRSGRFGGFTDSPAELAAYLEQIQYLPGATTHFPFVSMHDAAAATKRPSLVIEATTKPSSNNNNNAGNGHVEVQLSYAYMNLDEQARLYASFTITELTLLGIVYPWKRGELLPSELHKWLRSLVDRWTFCDPSDEPLTPEEQDRLCAQARAVMYWPIELLSPMGSYKSRNVINEPVHDRIQTFHQLLDYFYGTDPLPRPESTLAVQTPYYEQLATYAPAFVRAIKGAAYYLY